MDKKKIKLVLGSASPRRQELLKASFLNFEVRASHIEEVSICTCPSLIAEDIALQKAKAVLSSYKSEHVLVLGADTIVLCDNEILGKPRDRDEARETLMKLSGRTHHVITGVALLTEKERSVFSVKTKVCFQEITKDLLEAYLDTQDSMDKAGSYGIQAGALGFIETLCGSYSNVVGLPIDKVIIALRKMFASKDDFDGKWRERFE